MILIVYFLCDNRFLCKIFEMKNRINLKEKANFFFFNFLQILENNILFYV